MQSAENFYLFYLYLSLSNHQSMRGPCGHFERYHVHAVPDRNQRGKRQDVFIKNMNKIIYIFVIIFALKLLMQWRSQELDHLQEQNRNWYIYISNVRGIYYPCICHHIYLICHSLEWHAWRWSDICGMPLNRASHSKVNILKKFKMVWNV